jgi:hypothetical protein
MLHLRHQYRANESPVERPGRGCRHRQAPIPQGVTLALAISVSGFL